MADDTNLQSAQAACETVAQLGFVSNVLKLVCEFTGMRWSAVAHVTDQAWTACAVQDGLNFGLQPGGHIDIDKTFCIDVKRELKPVVMDRASSDPVYATHPIPALFGFESYLSVPITLPDGSFFGTLCALDPEPRTVSDTRTLAIFEAFCRLIGEHLAVEQQRDRAQAALLARMRTVPSHSG